MTADPAAHCPCLICAGSSEALSHAEADTLLGVQRHGWQVIKIEADSEGPSQAFSLGLFHSFEHAEVVIFGLPTHVMHTLINDVGEAVRLGRTFEPDERYSDFLTGYDVIFRSVHAEQYPEHLGWATWFFRYHPFPVLQMVWPNRDGHFPWETGTSSEYRALQPVLDAPLARS